MSDIAYWLQNHTGNPSVILFTIEICNWYNKMPFFFMNKCCGSAQKVFTVLSSLVRIATMLDTKYKLQNKVFTKFTIWSRTLQTTAATVETT